MCSGEMKTRWCVFQSKYKLNQPFTIIGLRNISYVLFLCSDLCAIAWGCCAAGTLGNALADPTSRASQPSLSSWHYPGWDCGAGWQNRQLMLLVSTLAAGAAREGFVNESSILRGF